MTREMPTGEVALFFVLTWSLHGGGSGREEDGVCAAMACETGRILAAHDGVCKCDRWLAVFSSVDTEQRDGEMLQ